MKLKRIFTTHNPITFWTSKVKVTADRQGDECIHVDAGTSEVDLVHPLAIKFEL